MSDRLACYVLVILISEGVLTPPVLIMRMVLYQNKRMPFLGMFVNEK